MDGYRYCITFAGLLIIKVTWTQLNIQAYSFLLHCKAHLQLYKYCTFSIDVLYIWRQSEYDDDSSFSHDFDETTEYVCWHDNKTNVMDVY